MPLRVPLRLPLSAARNYIAEKADLSPADYEVLVSLHGALIDGNLSAQGEYRDQNNNPDYKKIPVDVWKRLTELEFENHMYNPRYHLWSDDAEGITTLFENPTIAKKDIDTWLGLKADDNKNKAMPISLSVNDMKKVLEPSNLIHNNSPIKNLKPVSTQHLLEYVKQLTNDNGEPLTMKECEKRAKYHFEGLKVTRPAVRKAHKSAFPNLLPGPRKAKN